MKRMNTNIEFCDSIDKETGLRDCWVFTCPKRHTQPFVRTEKRKEHMDLKEAMIQTEERLEAHKQLINKIVNECAIASVSTK